MASLRSIAQRFETVRSKVGDPSTIQVVDGVTTVTLSPDIEYWDEEEASQTPFREAGELDFYSPVKVYLSHNALELMSLKSEISQPGYKNESLAWFHLFFEVDPEGEEDFLTGTYAGLAFTPVEGMQKVSYREEARFFIETTVDISHLVRQYSGNDDYDDYKDWIEDELDPNPISVMVAKTLLAPVRLSLEVGIWALEKITPEVYNLKMPEEVWNKKKRPDDMEQWLKDFSNDLEQKIKDAIDWVGSIPKIGEVQFAAVAVPKDMELLLEKIREVVNRIVGMIHEAAAFVKEIVPNIKDTIDTMIGYVSGLWDGVVDLVGGFLDMALLLFKAALAQVKAFEDLPAFIELLGEGIDEIIQGIARVNWGKVWHHIMTKTYPKFKEFLELKWEQAMDNADNAGLVAYHLGYLVFTIAENFFPPLKLSKAAGLASKLSGPLQKMFKISD